MATKWMKCSEWRAGLIVGVGLGALAFLWRPCEALILLTRAERTDNVDEGIDLAKRAYGAWASPGIRSSIAESYLLKCAIARRDGRVDDARTALDLAIAYAPGNGSPFRSYARVEIDAGNWQVADFMLRRGEHWDNVNGRLVVASSDSGEFDLYRSVCRAAVEDGQLEAAACTFIRWKRITNPSASTIQGSQVPALIAEFLEIVNRTESPVVNAAIESALIGSH